MKTILTLLGMSLVATVALGQQDPLYTQYINNPFVLNPAYAGTTSNLNASLSYRKQWAGFEGSPATINANGHLSLQDNTMGAGLMIVSDKIGVTSTHEIYGSYAYRISVGEAKKLSFGLQAGIINFRTKNASLTLQDPGDPAFAAETSESKPGIGAGVMLTSDRFLIGVSVPRMLSTRTAVGETDFTYYTQHVYVMASAVFFLNERIRFKPSVLAKMVQGAPASFDVNAALILYEKYTAGIVTRNLSTYGVFMQALIRDSFRFGYAMEIPTGRSVGSQFSTHEITLGVCLNVLRFHNSVGITTF